MKKKVLVIASTFPRWKGDVTPRFVYDLSKNLSSNFEVTVLAPHHNGAKKKEIMDNLKVRRFAYFKPESLQKLCYEGGMIPNMKKSFLAKIQMPFLILSEFFASLEIIKKEKIGLVHAHWIFPQGFVAVFLKKLYKIPLLVTVHGSDLFALKNILFRKLQNFVIRNSDLVTVNSTATKNELLSRFPDYSYKVKVIPMGVDLNLFNRKNVKKPKKYTKNKILLSVGRLSDQKGLQYLIDSIPDIIKLEPKIKLLIIGQGPYENNLRKLVYSKGLEGYVEFIGPMTASKISEYYKFADIFVMPSLSTKTGTEALGLSLLEAMASGCAVIGTDVGGIPSIIEKDYNGLLVKQKNSKNLSNAVLALLKNKQKSRKLGQNAAKFVRNNYSWDKISKEFSDLYRVLLK